MRMLRHEDGREDHEESSSKYAGDSDEDDSCESEGDDGNTRWRCDYLVMMLVYLINFKIF